MNSSIVRFNIVALFVVLFCIFVNSKPNVQDVCKKPKVAAVDETFLKETRAIGFSIPFHMKLTAMLQNRINSDRLNLTETQPIKGNGKPDRCYDLSAKARIGSFLIPYKCKPFDVNRLRCHILQKLPVSTGAAPLKATSILPRGDSFQPAKTDNATYIVYTGCLVGSRPIWFVLSAHGPLRKSIKESILKFIVGLGFHKKDISHHSDPVVFDRLTFTDCSKPTTKVVSEQLTAFIQGLDIPKHLNNTEVVGDNTNEEE